MSLLTRRKKGAVDRRQSLAGIPVLHPNLRIEEESGRGVTLKITSARGDSFFDRFRPPVMEKRYELDDFGAFVIRQIDNKRNVLEIIAAFERRFRMNHRESELGVVAFLKMLMKRGVLSVMVKP